MTGGGGGDWKVGEKTGYEKKRIMMFFFPELVTMA